MPVQSEKIRGLVRKGVLLFAQVVPFPSAPLVAAIGAAVIYKVLDLHQKRVSEILSSNLMLDHIPYVEPDQDTLLHFYRSNPIYPELASQFNAEIIGNQIDRLRAWYPFLYSALILKRQIPTLLFHQEIEQKRYRELAQKYEELSRGYLGVAADPEVQDQIHHFAGELLEIINEIYEAAKDEIKDTENQFAFDVIDYIREVAAL